MDKGDAVSFHPTFYGRNLDQALWEAASKLNQEPGSLEYRATTVDEGFVMVEVLNAPMIEVAPVMPVFAPQGGEAAKKAAPKRRPAGEVPKVSAELPYLQVVREVLREILGRLGLEGSFEVTERDGDVHVQLDEAHAEVLLGQDGRLLDSLRHLVNRMVHQQRQGGAAILMDVQGRLAARETALHAMAQRVADFAVALGGAVAVDTLPSSDRRLIHGALANRHDVRTESVGSGAYRRFVIRSAGH